MGLIEVGALLTPQVCAMLGGLIGGVIGSDREKYGTRLSVVLILASAITGGAVIEYLAFNNDFKLLLVGTAIAIPVGIFTGSLMDAIRLASAPLATKIVGIVGNKVTNEMEEKL